MEKAQCKWQVGTSRYIGKYDRHKTRTGNGRRFWYYIYVCKIRAQDQVLGVGCDRRCCLLLCAWRDGEKTGACRWNNSENLLCETNLRINPAEQKTWRRGLGWWGGWVDEWVVGARGGGWGWVRVLGMCLGLVLVYTGFMCVCIVTSRQTFFYIALLHYAHCCELPLATNGRLYTRQSEKKHHG